jgi:two-component system, chemotaxis family, CheB/CheR fusion protein
VATEQLEGVIERIRHARNFDFRNYKRATLRRRIERRMSDRRCKSIREYVALLERSPKEYDALVSSLLIKVTSFFRDPEAWEGLASRFLPDLVASKAPGDEIRVWSAGCATGEEAYSAAILFSEHLGPKLQNYQLKVFGTDVDEAAIAHARRGIYGPPHMEGLSKERIDRFFTRSPEGHSISKDLRRLVVFGVNNLVSDAPISRLDLLICRNVFIYLDAALQKRILSRFHYALRHAGILFLGKSELIPFAATLFDQVDLSRRLYRRGSRSGVVNEERLLGQLEQEDVARAVRQTQEDLGALRDVHRDALYSIPVPVIATSLDGSVQTWNPAAARLWKRNEGDVRGKKLTALALTGISGDLLVEKSALVREGKSESQTAEGLVPTPSGPREVRVEVTAAHNGASEMTGLVYTAHDITPMRSLSADLQQAREDRGRAAEDLQTANEELQSSNEELETTNEELQSANEELQTTNEELQSINEELETTNEELQSTNAELDATNRELAHRTDELNVLSYYQRTIIRSLSAAVVVVDPQGRITLWNLASERLLGLTENEALGQLLWTLRIPVISRAFVKNIRRNLGKHLALRVEDITYDRPGGGRGHAALSAIPLVDEDRVLGAVIIVEDTTRAVVLAEERLREGGVPMSRKAPRG